jgi:hypothetical protein
MPITDIGSYVPTSSSCLTGRDRCASVRTTSHCGAFERQSGCFRRPGVLAGLLDVEKLVEVEQDQAEICEAL